VDAFCPCACYTAFTQHVVQFNAINTVSASVSFVILFLLWHCSENRVSLLDHLARDGVQWRAFVKTVMNQKFPYNEEDLMVFQYLLYVSYLSSFFFFVFIFCISSYRSRFSYTDGLSPYLSVSSPRFHAGI
jgi:hypothetical protein